MQVPRTSAKSLFCGQSRRQWVYIIIQSGHDWTRFANEIADFRATFAAIKSGAMMRKYTGRCLGTRLNGGLNFFSVKAAANANDHYS